MTCSSNCHSELAKDPSAASCWRPLSRLVRFVLAKRRGGTMSAGKGKTRLTRGQFLQAVGAAGALAAVGGASTVGAQAAPEGVVLSRPIRGRLNAGRTAQYVFDYPGDKSV